MKTERLEIPVETQRVAAVAALWTAPAGSVQALPILLANGAGLPMRSPWMTAVAEGLTARGFGVLRFDYPYQERSVREGRRLPPDRRPVLEDCHARVLAALVERTGVARPILAGKSMGARLSTILAAKDVPCRGLVLFGYPLHPAGKPERLRSEHFPAVVQPALFLQGTRDALCDLALLERELARYGGSATVEVVEGADHGFHVLKRSGRSDEAVLETLLDRTAAWIEESFGTDAGPC